MTEDDQRRVIPADATRRSIECNVEQWSRVNREHTEAGGFAAWTAEEIRWGVFHLAEDAIGSPLGEVDGLDVVELGCGTAYVPAWLARRGARPVGVDPTPAQLETAQRLQAETGIEFPLVEAPGESGTEYHLAHGDWIRLLRRHGFDVEDLIELQARPDAQTHGYYDYVSADWGRRWPAEEMWVARRRDPGASADEGHARP